MGYVVNFLRKHHWKVARTLPYEDAMQEAYVVYLRCKRRYSGTVTEPAHFMALFKTAWRNRFIDLSNEDTADRVTLPYDVNDHERVGEYDNAGILATMIRQAPPTVKAVLSLLLCAPADVVNVVMRSWEDGSEQVNRLLGFPEDQETMQEVRDYFSER